ncbi:hypothetical protein LSAT2_012218 [Lamellibrachia satsuma]|nr:hypothetical protein LSAT2_012218 [Lamellibrachia satsuma]
MIEVYKYLHGIYRVDEMPLQMDHNTVMRGHSLKFKKERVTARQQRTYFRHRVVNRLQKERRQVRMSETAICTEAPASCEDSISKVESAESSVKRKRDDTKSNIEETSSNKKVCTESSIDKDNREAGATNEKLKSENNEVEESNKSVQPDDETAVPNTGKCKEDTREKLDATGTTLLGDTTNSCETGKREDAISAKTDIAELDMPEEPCDKNKSGHDISKKVAEKSDGDTSEQKDNKS